jgi:hypothetical protein
MALPMLHSRHHVVENRTPKRTALLGTVRARQYELIPAETYYPPGLFELMRMLWSWDHAVL